ncbi:MAG: hypothetical protein KBT06_02705 [Prevotellaceae bacterium]|nr:hypothetical protein [Candidatus Colivivens equi]
MITKIAKIKDFECFSAYLTMQSNRFSIKLSTFAKDFANEPQKNIVNTQFLWRGSPASAAQILNQETDNSLRLAQTYITKH